MFGLDLPYIIIIVGIILIIVEILIGAIDGFELFILGLIFIISGAIGALTGSTIVMIASIIVLTVLYLLFGRSYVKRALTVKTKKTNADSLIGKNGVVTKEIKKDAPGQVKVESEIWRAEANKDISEKSTIVVKSISGVTLEVEVAEK